MKIWIRASSHRFNKTHFNVIGSFTNYTKKYRFRLTAGWFLSCLETVLNMAVNPSSGRGGESEDLLAKQALVAELRRSSYRFLHAGTSSELLTTSSVGSQSLNATTTAGHVLRCTSTPAVA